MNLSDEPYKIQLPWAANAPGSNVTDPIPVSGGQPNGHASFNDGFPPINSTPVSAGGIPPWASDANGAFKVTTAWARWQAAGVPAYYDGTFSAAIGGYPKGAVLANASTFGLFWVNLVDGNTTDPDTGGANWQQFPPPLPPGATSRLTANLASPGTSVQFTADYVSVAVSLGGAAFVLANFSQTLNVATTGPGGMDTGSAPASGFVSVYAIYDQIGKATSILGTTQCQTTVYTGADMPAGYTASTLIAIWQTNGSRNLVTAAVIDRDYWYQSPISSGALNAGSATAYTAISLSSLVPAAARLVHFTGAAEETNSVAGSSVAEFVPNSASTTAMIIIPAAVLNLFNYAEFDLPMVVAQTTYYKVGQSTMRASLNVNGYRI